MLNGREISSDRQIKPRRNITAIEDVVARIGQLKPRILFVNLDQSTDEGFALLEALHRECLGRL